MAEPHSTPVRLSVVVPTRNEAGNVALLLERLAASLSAVAYEVIFVDDSTDDTPTVLAQLAREHDGQVRVIFRPPERRNGLSGAVVEGMAAARGEWVCVMDADLQHPPEAVARLLAQAERSGADLIVASRRADFTGPMGLSRARALTSQSLTILARGLFPRVLKNVSDPLTGFFLVRRSALDLDRLQPEGFKILLEILVRHPELHVSEIYFDFAQRNEGQSKADLHEGVRYFRHLTRLRWSVNRHLARFLLVILAAVALNLVLLAALVDRGGWSLPTGAAVAGVITVVALLLGEAWVFSDRPQGLSRHRLLRTLLLGPLYLILIYLPVVLVLSRLGVPTLLAALLALSLAGFVYYLFSEYWIWTRGLTMHSRTESYYDVHGLLTVVSQVPLSDLQHFEIAHEPARIDLRVRVDRHGTPNLPPDALKYDEQLGRFGFSVAVMPGDYSEVVVSPLLESSPGFLYTNVVEPVLHWLLVTRGLAFLPVAAVAAPTGEESGATEILPEAQLLSGTPDMAHGLVQMAGEHPLGFMGDDRVILAGDGLVWAFPKPVTINQAMLDQASAATRAVAPLTVQRLVYSRRIRRLGIWLGAQRLPAATFNSYVQRLIPQPKYDLQELVPNVRVVEQARAAGLILFEPNGPGPTPTDTGRIDDLVSRGWPTSGSADGFQPLATLSAALANWGGEDWIAVEQAIARQGLRAFQVQVRQGQTQNWWEQLAAEPNHAPTRHLSASNALVAPQL